MPSLRTALHEGGEEDPMPDEFYETVWRMLPWGIIALFVFAAIFAGIEFLITAAIELWRIKHPKKVLPRYLRRMR